MVGDYSYILNMITLSDVRYSEIVQRNGGATGEVSDLGGVQETFSIGQYRPWE